MNQHATQLEHFYQQGSKDTDVLERNANDYPYSSLAEVLLLYHYKKTNHPAFEQFAKKTALHFKNQHWLQFILEQSSLEKPGSLPVISENLPEANNNVNELPAKEEPQITNEQNSDDLLEKSAANKPLIEDKPRTVEPDIEVSPVIVPEILQEQMHQQEYIEDAHPEESLSDIPFEPLHTVDYFASQGIKVTDVPLANDKLGNQMKSFTAWLKSMKKLHASKPEEQDTATERIIQTSAEESNINTEILTEAMAEVLIKQDKREKAIEMFNKLSLINPSKSAYFAAKIESIKSS